MDKINLVDKLKDGINTTLTKNASKDKFMKKEGI